MNDNADPSLKAFLDKSKEIFDPSFFGPYSFEYAYRLFLVYISTHRQDVQGIRMSDPNAFDHAFNEDIEKAVIHILEYRGIDKDKELISSLTELANDSLILFIKSPKPALSIKVAAEVANAMDKKLSSSLKAGKRIAVTKAFSEFKN